MRLPLPGRCSSRVVCISAPIVGGSRRRQFQRSAQQSERRSRTGRVRPDPTMQGLHGLAVVPACHACTRRIRLTSSGIVAGETASIRSARGPRQSPRVAEDQFASSWLTQNCLESTQVLHRHSGCRTAGAGQPIALARASLSILPIAQSFTSSRTITSSLSTRPMTARSFNLVMERLTVSIVSPR